MKQQESAQWLSDSRWDYDLEIFYDVTRSIIHFLHYREVLQYDGLIIYLLVIVIIVDKRVNAMRTSLSQTPIR